MLFSAVNIESSEYRDSSPVGGKKMQATLRILFFEQEYS